MHSAGVIGPFVLQNYCKQGWKVTASISSTNKAVTIADNESLSAAPLRQTCDLGLYK